MPTENRSNKTDMAAGLLPCPFCGGSNLHIEAYSVQPDNYHGARVQCMDCEFDAPCGITLKDGGWSSNPEDAKADAATVWNIRMQPAAQHKGEPVAWAVFTDSGNIRIWSTDCEAVGIKVMQEEGKQAVPLYLHPPTSDGFSAGDMADQGAKAFAARDGEVEELRARLVERDTALTRILERCDVFIGDERDMRVQSVEAIREIAARAVAP